jgi:hypothetical protein
VATPLRRLGVLPFALLVALALPAAASAGSGVKGSVRVSNERTFTMWAHPARTAAIRTRPSPRAHTIVATQAFTESGFPEVYLVLRKFGGRHGDEWLQVRIPMRPNGHKGWVRSSALGPLYHVRTQLVVDRSRLRATLYRNGHRRWSAPVGVGKSSTPTPAGHFWVTEKFKTQNPAGPYGPVAFGTSDYSVLSDWPGGGVIGIHGTDEPALIPGRPSHGCIRVRNEAISRLWHKLPIGTPVRVR